ncbi:mitochondrial carrier [Athelia psychrophila]|uniref:Mitochondrial carrier n=1 Tax=Athelia psychrophila TaxID=1759441 RepID=A0A166RTY5_9AGAM|nr:mitochondrial carrier [Fibularhizoctonia sp. CBS 109695]
MHSSQSRNRRRSAACIRESRLPWQASCALLNGLIFASYGWFLNLQLDDPQTPPTLWQVVLAGVATGVVSSMITAPVELVKIRQQNELSNSPSVKTVTSQIYRQHGIRGLYRGITATMLRDTSYGPYFGTYEACCRFFTPIISDHPASTPRPGPTGWGLLFAGGIAGIVGWCVSFPMDVVKTRVQNTDWTPHIPLDAESTHLVPSSLSQASSGNPYRTTLSTIIHSYREEGISVFFRGLSTALIRAIPVNIVIFAAFDFTARVLS